MGSGQSNSLYNGGPGVGAYIQRSQSQSKEKRGNFDSNYVDRVRLRDPSIDTPGRASGWRQKSLSDIDLTSTNCYKSSFRYCDFDDDLCSASKKSKSEEYEDLYGVNPKGSNHRSQSYQENGACSLRRTRSLAVIKEETYNDLQISGQRTRRSQLIPRAKLVEKNFFQDRFTYHNDDSCSGLEGQESDEIEKRHPHKDPSQPYPWQGDKSDLDSIDSSIFKHSLHQTGLELGCIETNEEENYQTVSCVEVHEVPREPVKQKTNLESDLKLLDEISLSSSQNTLETIRKYPSVEFNIKEEGESGITIIRIGEEPEPPANPSVISYDSIYLSSESSDLSVDPLQELTISTESGLIDIHAEDSSVKSQVEGDYDKEEAADADRAEHIIDTLYSEVTKAKPKNSHVEPKKKKRPAKAAKQPPVEATVDQENPSNISLISTFREKKKHQNVQNLQRSNGYQYNSLPDIRVSHILRTSERIDKSLRSKCKPDLSIIEPPLEPIPDYGSIPEIGKTHKNKETSDIVDTEEEFEDEQQDEVETVDSLDEVTPEQEKNISKVYLSEVSSEIEYEATVNSAVNFEQQQANPLTESDNASEVSGANHYELIECFEEKRCQEPTSPPKIQVIISDLSDDTTRENLYTKINKVNTIKKQPLKKKLEVQIITPEEKALIPVQPTTEPIYDKKSQPPAKLKPILKKEKSFANLSTFEVDSPFLKSSKKETNPFLDGFVESSDSSTGEEGNNYQEILKIQTIYTATPIQVREEKRTHCDIRYKNKKSPFTLAAKKSLDKNKMPRPQLLQIIDTKRNICHVAPQQQNNQLQSHNYHRRALTPNTVAQQQEFQHKVHSVRTFWSKILDTPESERNQGEGEENNNDGGLGSDFDESLLASPDVQRRFPSKFHYTTTDNGSGDFQSFCPTVEIIELDGQKQATVVKAKDLDEVDFDHVRYRVMKSNMFQKNLIVNHRKEAQFDGLMQYLQDYSFQELLANNNVVIIEPVRTKIEKVTDKPQAMQMNTCKITGGSAEKNGGKSGLRKHFFYHPIRVNRELLDEELPSPDTVRNVRKMFERSLRHNKSIASTDSKTLHDRSSENLRKKTLRYLTIDTSYGNSSGIRKWDSSSLSSGISSGDLSSPCECLDNESTDTKNIYSSEENLCDDDDEDYETHYVSPDVMEKIRECGSTVTYYGGRVLNRKVERMNPMTKTIMREIKGEEKKCHVCQPKNCPHTDNENYLGMRFKLVKSNSCSSRLELTGTHKTPPDLHKCLDEVDEDQQNSLEENRSLPELEEETEDTVRDKVSRLETGTIFNRTKPRIIESKCIEKAQSELNISKLVDQPVTINSHSIKVGSVDLLNQVTVNNHITFASAALKSQGSSSDSKTKVCRNRNVDLAFPVINKSSVNKPNKNKENLAKKASIIQEQHHIENIHLPKDSIVEQPISNPTFKHAKGNLAEQNRSKNNKNNNVETNDNNNNDTIHQLEIPPKETESIRVSSSNLLNVKSVDEAKTKEESDSNNNNNINNKNSKYSNYGMHHILSNQFDEKQYIANDIKLVQKKKYDEMEFEEFEVADAYGSVKANKTNADSDK